MPDTSMEWRAGLGRRRTAADRPPDQAGTNGTFPKGNPEMHMQKFGRTAVISGTALALALGAAPAGSAAAAPATPTASAVSGTSGIGVLRHPHPTDDDHFTFTRRDESFSHRDWISRFNAHVDLDRQSSRRYPMRWSFQITSDRLQDMARGPAVCTTRSGDDHDHDHDDRGDREVVRVGEVWHSQVRSHRVRRQYELSGECKFRVREGGRRGEARVSFDFSYEINPWGRGGGQHDVESAFDTDFDYDR